MSKGDQVIISTTSNGSTQGKATLLVSDVVLAEKSAKTTFIAPVNGSYTISYAGESLSYGVEYTKSSNNNYVLTAIPNNGYSFLGWFNNSNDLLSTNTSLNYIGLEDHQIRALFHKSGNAVFYIKETPGFFYDFFDNAITAAGSNKTIVTYKSGSISGSAGQTSFTIPSGVTLLVPFDDNATLNTTSPTVEGGNYYAKPSLFRNLTLLSGTQIIVEYGGAICVNSKISAGAGGSKNSGAPTGKYGQISMQEGSSIIVSGSMYAYGFITGSGTVEINSNGKVYESFQVLDTPGGSHCKAYNGNSNGAFFFNQYSIQNIEAPMTINAGATETVYTALYINNDQYTASAVLIGSSSGLFRLSSGSITKRYIPSEDRLQFDINGNISVASISLSVSSYSMDTSKYFLPISPRININVHSGTTTINSNVKLLPDVRVAVDYNAILNISSGKNLYIYDINDWNSTYFYAQLAKNVRTVAYTPSCTPADHNPSSSARIDVNGQLTVAGKIYTSSSGANIFSSEKTGRVVLSSAPGSDYTMKQGTGYSGSSLSATATYEDVTFNPAKLRNGTNHPTSGDYAVEDYTLTAGSSANTTFYYCSSCDAWYNESHDHIIIYTITWLDDDGSVLATTEVEDGELPVYSGSTPVKNATAQYTYTFAGWTPTVVAAVADATYTATYTATIRSYTVIWKNCDGTVLETDENVEAGTMPEYNRSTPVKAADDEKEYVFSGWDPEIAAVSGDIIYTAVYTEQPHDWSAPEWTWNSDYSTATATFVCENDETHTKTVNATVTNVHTDPGCEIAGSDVYTATVVFNGQTYTDIKTVEIQATGHVWGGPTWTWSSDYSTATATFVCGSDQTHTQTVNATITNVHTDSGCETAGSDIYTATVTFNGQIYTDIKTVEIQATGHAWGSPTWTWSADYSSATATFVCENDESHVVTVSDNDIERVLHEPESGSTVYTYVYTAQVEGPDGQTYSSNQTKEGLFAGWYKDADLTEWYTESDTFDQADAYAKLVDPNILRFAFQLKTSATLTDESTVIRALSSVDTLNYKSVGFIVSYTDNEGNAKTYRFETTTVYSSITGTSDIGAFEYPPTIFSPDSTRFFAFNLTLPCNLFETAIEYTPFWVTYDGTQVTGTTPTPFAVSQYMH